MLLFLLLIVGVPALGILVFVLNLSSCPERFCDVTLTNALLAYFTYCLVVVGAFQGWFLLDAGKAARATAEAASRQARASVSSELPVLGFAGQKLIAYDSLGNATRTRHSTAAYDASSRLHQERRKEQRLFDALLNPLEGRFGATRRTFLWTHGGNKFDCRAR